MTAKFRPKSDKGSNVLRRRVAGGIGFLALALSSVLVTAVPAQATAPITPWDTTWSTSALDFSGFNPGNLSWWGQSMCGNTAGFNCTNYVAYRLASNGVSSFMGGCGATNLGSNAQSWDNRARACGIRVDKVPAPGSVVVFESNAPTPVGGQYETAGHVAYVDGVEGDKLYISEASCGLQKGHRATWSAASLASQSGWSIIHPKDLAGGGGNVARYWALNYANDSSAPELSFNWGESAVKVLSGDWDGDGVDTVGYWKAGTWYLANSNSAATGFTTFAYGNATDVPLVGDWNGDGKDTIGVWRPGNWALNDQNDGSAPEYSFMYGNSTDTPLVGDWNGDGKDTIGVWRPGNWALNDQNDGSAPEYSFMYGNSTDTPLVGDWNGDGRDTIGVWRPGNWALNDQTDGSAPEYSFMYGNSTDTPLVGDWNGAGKDTIGVTHA